jgi:hypothetical protein
MGEMSSTAETGLWSDHLNLFSSIKEGGVAEVTAEDIVLACTATHGKEGARAGLTQDSDRKGPEQNKLKKSSWITFVAKMKTILRCY